MLQTPADIIERWNKNKSPAQLLTLKILLIDAT